MKTVIKLSRIYAHRSLYALWVFFTGIHKIYLQDWTWPRGIVLKHAINSVYCIWLTVKCTDDRINKKIVGGVYNDCLG